MVEPDSRSKLRFANWRVGSSVGERALPADVLEVEGGMSSLGTSPSPVDFSKKTVLRSVVVAVVAGVVLAILGPFGSYMNGGALRLAAYWIGAMLFGVVIYGAAYKLLRERIAPASSKWWPGVISVTLIASVPEALATRAGAFLLWPDLERLGLPLSLWFAQTATVGMLCMIGASVIMRRGGAVPRPERGNFLVVPLKAASLGEDVLALQMEDHYVRVHRPTGSELLLMPLGEAIERVNVEGMRTHRSWWVARDAVTAVEGNARSMRVHLSNGLIAPVARSAVTHIKAAGWTTADHATAGHRTPPSSAIR